MRLEHIQVFATTELVLRYQHVNAVLVPLAVVGADTRDRIDRVVVAPSCSFVIGFFSFAVLAPLLLLLGSVFKINREELLVELVVLDFAIDDSFIEGKLLARGGGVDIFEYKEDVTFNVGPSSLV